MYAAYTGLGDPCTSDSSIKGKEHDMLLEIDLSQLSESSCAVRATTLLSCCRSRRSAVHSLAPLAHKLSITFETQVILGCRTVTTFACSSLYLPERSLAGDLSSRFVNRLEGEGHKLGI